MKNLEKYIAIGEQKKIEKKKEAGERKEQKEARRTERHEAAAAKRKERMDKMKEAGKNILGRIGKTAENASLLRRALPEVGKDAISDLKQGAENKIKRLLEKGSEASNKCSGRIEKARSGVRGWIERWQEGRKIKETKKLIEKCVPIILQITENAREMSSLGKEKIRPKIESLKGLLELRAIISQGGKAKEKVRESMNEQLASASI